MYRVLSCLAVEHNLWLVALAGLICFLASHATIVLVQRGKVASGPARWIWLGVAGASGGFGIWSTHFIAMLAYDPGVVVGYEPELTFLSLAMAMVATFAAVACAAFLRGFTGYAAAGVLFGAGVASMHFTGMIAIEFPGSIVWDYAYVVVSIAIGAMLSTLAFHVASTAKSHNARKFGGTILLTLGVVLLHFTAMGGVTVVSGVETLDPASLLSPSVMVISIAATSLSLLTSGLMAMTFAVRAESQAAASEANFKRLVQGVTDYAIYMLDVEGRVSNWNAGAQRAKGHTADEIVGQDFAKFYSWEDRRKGLPARALATALTEGKFEDEGWRFRKDGSSFWAHVVIDPIRDESGKLLGYASITRDKTRQKRNEDRIAIVTRNLDIALENMSQGICLFDKDERLVLANKHYSEIFGFPASLAVAGRPYREILEQAFLNRFQQPEIALPRAAEHYERAMAVVRSGSGSTIQKYQDGRSIQAIYNATSDGGWVVTFEDITQRLQSEEKIAYMARHDGLTGLPNRAEFNEMLGDEIKLAERTHAKVAVIGIDLDKFKEINDQHGHAAGDQVLVALAEAMTAMLQQDEFVARFGGDEFAAIKRFTDMSELHDFAGRLEKCLVGDMNIDSFEVRTGASLGIALYPADATDGEQLLANADLAMYRAKNSLIQRVCFYEGAMDEAARSRRALANDLWVAIEKKQFHLNYQVQKSVATGAITGYEVLLRWHHPERGNVPPMDFITLAEECGAILPIGEWVLAEACREAATWEMPHKIAVNLSPVQLGHADMAAIVRNVLIETGLNPKRLEIEITESSIITDKNRALMTLRQIKDLGVSIAIDDFGTGYSSLETLRAFPFDKIKLDRSFMNEVETSPQAKAIIRAILALGQSLQVPVLAEGVETQDQLEILLSEGCDEAQGYFLGRPKPISDLLRKIAEVKAA
ncbi:bifunctional diguanylate cyclase/phosphodiesterase [Rhizobium sp. LjRoot254]|uniref:bifunctional diguanylate cyclase/phosphodiesterase n=1 Tax=Rhizobium sp. LjRoot254 TaxID=3342297 RepID=UPI003ED084C7